MDTVVFQHARAAFSVYYDVLRSAPPAEGGEPQDVRRCETFTEPTWQLKANLIEVACQSTSYIIVAFRGTDPTKLGNIQSDLRCAQVPLALDIPGKAGALVHHGFQDMYMTSRDKLCKEITEFVKGRKKKREISQFVKGRKAAGREKLQIVCTGHSLGGSLATLCALDLATRGITPSVQDRGVDMELDVSVTTFGKPHVGNRSFCDLVRSFVSVRRFTVFQDPVPMLLDPAARLPITGLVGHYCHEVPDQVLNVEETLTNLRSRAQQQRMSSFLAMLGDIWENVPAHTTGQYWKSLQKQKESEACTDLRCLTFQTPPRNAEDHSAYIAASVYRMQREIAKIKEFSLKIFEHQLMMPAAKLESEVQGAMQLLEDGHENLDTTRMAPLQNEVKNVFEQYLDRVEEGKGMIEKDFQTCTYLAYVLHMSIAFELQHTSDCGGNWHRIATNRLKRYGGVCGRFVMEAALRRGRRCREQSVLLRRALDHDDYSQRMLDLAREQRVTFSNVSLQSSGMEEQAEVTTLHCKLAADPLNNDALVGLAVLRFSETSDNDGKYLLPRLLLDRDNEDSEEDVWLGEAGCAFLHGLCWKDVWDLEDNPLRVDWGDILSKTKAIYDECPGSSGFPSAHPAVSYRRKIFRVLISFKKYTNSAWLYGEGTCSNCGHTGRDHFQCWEGRSQLQGGMFSDAVVQATGSAEDRNYVSFCPVHSRAGCTRQDTEFVWYSIVGSNRGGTVRCCWWRAQVDSPPFTTPLHLLPLLRTLMDVWGCTERSDCAGQSKPLLHYFVSKPLHGSKIAVALLLRAKADAGVRDENHRTALHQAVEMKDQDAIELLLDHGVDVNAKDANLQAPLHGAVLANFFAGVELLIRQGANVHTRDKEGRTPLLCVTWHEFWAQKIKNALLGAGADENARDSCGKTARDYEHAYKASARAQVDGAFQIASAFGTYYANGIRHAQAVEPLEKEHDRKMRSVNEEFSQERNRLTVEWQIRRSAQHTTFEQRTKQAERQKEEDRRAELKRLQAEHAKKLEEMEERSKKANAEEKAELEQQLRAKQQAFEDQMKEAEELKEADRKIEQQRLQAEHDQKLHEMEEQKKAEEETMKRHFDQLRDEVDEQRRKAREQLEEIELRRQRERESCEREVAAAKEQLAAAMQQARDASNPEMFEQTQQQILQDFLSKIPTLSFISPLPAELQGKKTVLFLGDVSTGKTSLIRHLLIDHYEGDGRVGVGHATTELRAVAMKDSTVVFDSPGQNNNAWFIYSTDCLQSLHQMDVLAVTYITSLSTVRNLLEIAKVVSATRGSRVITVRTKIDLWKERGEPPLEEEMERDKALLNELGMTDIAMFATSAEPDKLPALIREKCQNAALTELLLSPCRVSAPASSERAPEVAEPEGAVAQAAGETAVAPPPRQALQTKAPVVPSAANEELRRKLEQRQHAMSHPSAAAAPAVAAALQPRSTDPVGMDEDLKQKMMKRRTWED